MLEKVTLSDIPINNRNKQYIVNTYNVSKTTAWRLLSGKADHIIPGYRSKQISISDDGWDLISDPDVVQYIKKCIVYQLRKWRVKPSMYLDDIAQECYIRLYCKSGIWSDMPTPKRNAYIGTLSKRTTNDIMSKALNYNNIYHNLNMDYENKIYACN